MLYECFRIDKSAEHGTDMDDNIDSNDHTDQGTGVYIAASTSDEVSHSNADDEEDGNSAWVQCAM